MSPTLKRRSGVGQDPCDRRWCRARNGRGFVVADVIALVVAPASSFTLPKTKALFPLLRCWARPHSSATLTAVAPDSSHTCRRASPTDRGRTALWHRADRDQCGFVFVNQAFPVTVPMTDAEASLGNLLRSDSQLQTASTTAFRIGMAAARADHGTGPITDIAHLPELRRGETVVVAIRWIMADPADAEEPVPDADLQRRALPNGNCELALHGSYRSPQTAGHAVIDRHKLDAVANTVCLALLDHIATILTHSVDPQTA